MSFILDGYNWDPSDPTSITNLLLAHVQITLLSMMIGLAIAFAAALVVVRIRRLYLPVITVSGIIYTIPSLALFAFLIPTTGLSAATLIIPLVLYAQLVLIRNIVAAIDAVDPQLVEVGRAMGMNRFQVQRYVVLPLALPVIVAGIRVATVTTIGIATLGPWVGTDDLGTLIFQGFNYAYPGEVAGGVILVSVLAIGVDLALLGVQRFLSRGRPMAVAAA